MKELKQIKQKNPNNKRRRKNPASIAELLVGYIPPVGAKNRKQEEEQIKSAPAYIAELQEGYIPPVEKQLAKQAKHQKQKVEKTTYKHQRNKKDL